MLYFVFRCFMDKRLLSFIKKIPDGKGVIDVGTDHGYIPVYLASHGYPGNILASDINPGPLNSGIQNAREAGVDEKIRFILCNGLEKCPPAAVDTILIAGMGGDTMAGILDRASWVMDRAYLLILQPMTKAEVLRYWLVHNGFEILSEELCEESGKVYQIITSRFGGSTELSDAELFTGKYEQIHTSAHFPQKLKKLMDSTGKSIAGLEKSVDPGKNAWKALLTEIYKELAEMNNRLMGERNADN